MEAVPIESVAGNCQGSGPRLQCMDGEAAGAASGLNPEGSDRWGRIRHLLAYPTVKGLLISR